MTLAGPRDEVAVDYPARIRRLRASLGMTQVQLAERMGVSFASVNRWENGVARPSALAWRQIVRAEQFGPDVLGPDASLSASAERPVADVSADGLPPIDFAADPEIVRLVAEGERLAYGHLFNPAFATETSLIEPLPHQRIAVYERMLAQPRLRFLLADDAGAGKTVMTGLYVREMLSRRLIRRVLVVPPAGLVGNWLREMQTLFRLPFRIVSGGEARHTNPFADANSDLVIVSVDTLAGERMFARLGESAVAPYDLVIFDEAHKLSADRDPDFIVRKTARYCLAEALAGIPSDDDVWALSWRPLHLLLLTATPHMGKDYPYYALWRLLEPEGLSTPDAFAAYPAAARRGHFIRRTKEEMVRFDGSRIFPTRVTDTHSYELTRGEFGEQRLYDETTRYIHSAYNRAQVLNRSAARLAMSIFQRRLASSTYALLRSFERRSARLDGLAEALRSGRLNIAQLRTRQRELDSAIRDVLDEETADEECAEGGREENELAEERAMAAVVARSLRELEAERAEVADLLQLARRVYETGEESKFEKLREVIQAPRFAGEKMIIFTEHRDTQDFLTRRLSGLGFTDQIALIHGGMDYQEREGQVAFFRRPLEHGGARFLVATDAAGEGINLQFCWLMVNYDIPWNPARLEQRMGRIHRYGQQHDPVVIVNLVAGGTREGRVLKVLLDKLEHIRRQLGSGKVFDVVGRLFQGVSLKQYMTDALTEPGAVAASREIDAIVTEERVEKLGEAERRLYGDRGEVERELPRLREDMEREIYRRLLPGYVRRFLERAAPLIGVGIDGDLGGCFALKPLARGGLDAIWPAIELYPEAQRECLTTEKPSDAADAIFLHPGEPLFERLRGYVCARFGPDALRGGIFVDPTADEPYLFHLALVTVERRADPDHRQVARHETIMYQLVGLKQAGDGQIRDCPVEHLLLLKGGSDTPRAAARIAASAARSRDEAREYLREWIAEPLAAERQRAMLDALAERELFIAHGYDYRDAELAVARARQTEKARGGDPRAKGELTTIRQRQRRLEEQCKQALALLRREPELVEPGEVTFLAHALVLPSSDPRDRQRHEEEVELIAVRLARAFEGDRATVHDVSTPAKARAAGLPDYPGFDLLSEEAGREPRAIEVKGRARLGDVELTENEWSKACNLRDRYWLYVAFDCATAYPRLVRVRDPFGKLIARTPGGVIVDHRAIFEAAEE